MATCSTCGNEYGRTFTITRDDQSATFDSFECAIQKLAPRCSHCEVAIVGHGVESEDKTYCCAHCARAEGVKGLRDHVESAAE